MRRVLLTMTLVLALAVVGGGRAGAAEVKLGFVDLQRALNECDQGKGARERFLGEPYNKPYYPAFFERFGFRACRRWNSFELPGSLPPAAFPQRRTFHADAGDQRPGPHRQSRRLGAPRDGTRGAKTWQVLSTGSWTWKPPCLHGGIQ